MRNDSNLKIKQTIPIKPQLILSDRDGFGFHLMEKIAPNIPDIAAYYFVKY